MTDLFKETKDLEDQVESDNPLEDLVGPGKRYADVQALAKAAKHQLPYIKRLEEEGEAQRQELQKRLSVEEYVSQLRQEIKESRGSDSLNEKKTPVNSEGSQIDAAALKKEMFSEFENLLTTQQKKARAERNVEIVREKLKEVWGNTYATQLKRKAEELSLSEDFLANLATDNPEAFLKITVGTPSTKVSSGPSVPTNQKNSAYREASNSNPTDRTKSYYDKLKKDNPKLYWSKQIQSQEHRDAVRLGSNFFDN